MVEVAGPGCGKESRAEAPWPGAGALRGGADPARGDGPLPGADSLPPGLRESLRSLGHNR